MRKADSPRAFSNFEQAAHHVRKHLREEPRAVGTGSRGDPDPCAPLGDGQGLPGAQRLGRAEALGGQVSGGVGRGDDRQTPVELPLDLAVEVVLVHVREHNEVDRRQGLQFERRIGPAGRRHAVPEVDVVAPVKEVRVCEDREPRVAEDHGRRADEEDRPLRPIGRAHVGARQAQLIGGVHVRLVLSVVSGARCPNSEVAPIASIRPRRPLRRRTPVRTASRPPQCLASDDRPPPSRP